MTPRPAGALAAIAATTAALRATAVATTAATCTPPGDQASSTPTTTDEKWGQIRPSRWGQRKSSFSRTREGKSQREIMRCLKRYIAREVYTTLRADLADTVRPRPALSTTIMCGTPGFSINRTRT
jgi:hypothetical protein